jgi:hypothetical protein
LYILHASNDDVRSLVRRLHFKSSLHLFVYSWPLCILVLSLRLFLTQQLLSFFSISRHILCVSNHKSQTSPRLPSSSPLLLSTHSSIPPTSSTPLKSPLSTTRSQCKTTTQSASSLSSPSFYSSGYLSSLSGAQGRISFI